MKIIMDSDEVIVDFFGPLLKKYNARYETKLTRDDIKEWVLPPGMQEIFMEKNFFRWLDPLPNAIEGMRALKAVGHNVVIATSPSGTPHIAEEKMHWVQDWLPEFADSMIITGDKRNVTGDLICDDRPDNLVNWPGPHKVIMDRRYNRSFQMQGLHRVCDFKGLLLVVDYLTINPSRRLY